MKTFKVTSAIILAFAMVISFATIAKADTATSWVAGPSLKLSRWVRGSTYDLTPGGVGYPQGSKSYVFFDGYGWLPMSFAPDDDRGFEVFLMEEDGLFNPNDTVKYYTGTFTGRQLTSMRYRVTVTPGDLDDNVTAEMYIDCKVYRTRKTNMSDPSDGTLIGKLFNYQIGINSN